MVFIAAVRAARSERRADSAVSRSSSRRRLRQSTPWCSRDRSTPLLVAPRTAVAVTARQGRGATRERRPLLPLRLAPPATPVPGRPPGRGRRPTAKAADPAYGRGAAMGARGRAASPRRGQLPRASQEELAAALGAGRQMHKLRPAAVEHEVDGPPGPQREVGRRAGGLHGQLEVGVGGTPFDAASRAVQKHRDVAAPRVVHLAQHQGPGLGGRLPVHAAQRFARAVGADAPELGPSGASLHRPLAVRGAPAVGVEDAGVEMQQTRGDGDVQGLAEPAARADESEGVLRLRGHRREVVDAPARRPEIRAGRALAVRPEALEVHRPPAPSSRPPACRNVTWSPGRRDRLKSRTPHHQVVAGDRTGGR